MGGMAGGATEVLVDTAEEVGRLCFAASLPITIDQRHPNHIDPATGLFRLEELTWTELKERGFSVQRVSLYTREDAFAELARRQKKWREKGKPAGYSLAGIVIANVESVNEIHDSKGGQVFRVLATPAHGLAHAEIKIGDAYKREDLLKHRVALRDALGQLRPVSVLRSEPATPAGRIARILQRSWRAIRRALGGPDDASA